MVLVENLWVFARYQLHNESRSLLDFNRVIIDPKAYFDCKSLFGKMVSTFVFTLALAGIWLDRRESIPFVDRSRLSKFFNSFRSWSNESASSLTFTSLFAVSKTSLLPPIHTLITESLAVRAPLSFSPHSGLARLQCASVPRSSATIATVNTENLIAAYYHQKNFWFPQNPIQGKHSR